VNVNDTVEIVESNNINPLIDNTVELDLFIANQEVKNFADSILKNLENFNEMEQFLFKKWIQKCLTANDFKNLEILHNEIVLFSNNNNYAKLNLNKKEIWVKSNALFEFKIPKKISKKKYMSLDSPYKKLHTNS
jgi:hypothetical protein